MAINHSYIKPYSSAFNEERVPKYIHKKAYFIKYQDMELEKARFKAGDKRLKGLKDDNYCNVHIFFLLNLGKFLIQFLANESDLMSL